MYPARFSHHSGSIWNYHFTYLLKMVMERIDTFDKRKLEIILKVRVRRPDRRLKFHLEVLRDF